MDLDGVVAGYASSTGFRGRPAYARTRETTIYVHPGHRRRGIASELMERLIAVLAERGIHRIVAGISLPNDASVALHERLGFTHVGTFTEVGAKFGRWHDVGFWQLVVDGGSDQAPGSPER
jgi:phosphinothricin acetyltransferase